MKKDQKDVNGGTDDIRGGATVLKVGRDKFCERSEQKFF